MNFIVRGLPLIIFFLPSCLSSGENAGDNVGGGGSNLSDFSTEDLAGEWVGTLESSRENRDAIPFYFRCSANGFPESGADALYRDWSLDDSVTYSWVRSIGVMNLTVIREDEMMLLNGEFDPSGLSIEGDFVMLLEGTEMDYGTFEVVLGPGTGGFQSDDQLVGPWEGEWKTDGNPSRVVDLLLDSDGVLLEGTIEGESIDLSGPYWEHQFSFSQDSVGRLAPIDLYSTAWPVLSLSYLIATEDGSLLSGPGLSLKRP